MSLYDKIISQCKLKNIKISNLEKLLDLSVGSISKWKTSSPKVENLQKVSDYFNVTIDYFLKEDKTMALKNNKSVVDNILNLLNLHHMTANELAKILGFGNSQFTSWKNGVAKPSMNALIKIAKYFKVSLDYLINIEENSINNEQNKKNIVTAVARNGRVIEIEYSDKEMQIIMNLLELTIK